MSMFKAEYQDFKREDPTVLVKVTLYDDDRNVIKPAISKLNLFRIINILVITRLPKMVINIVCQLSNYLDCRLVTTDWSCGPMMDRSSITAGPTGKS